jgi:hypothetical protein
VEKDETDFQVLRELRTSLGVPEQLGACHTAEIDGYVIEGHVPADVIKRLLEEKPEMTGLAVPGMPVGSPGMEGGQPQPYDVIVFDREGRTRVYEQR